VGRLHDELSDGDERDDVIFSGVVVMDQQKEK